MYISEVGGWGVGDVSNFHEQHNVKHDLELSCINLYEVSILTLSTTVCQNIFSQCSFLSQLMQLFSNIYGICQRTAQMKQVLYMRNQYGCR